MEPEQADLNAPEPPQPSPSEPRDKASHLKAHRWAKGTSGNPGGRKKGESLTAMLRRVLEQEHNGRPIGEILVERLVKEALTGKLPHLKEVFDRIEGRAKERHEVTGMDGQQLIIEIVPAEAPPNPARAEEGHGT
jgi:hypothetical protein